MNYPVSIIVPAYNCGAYLARCLNSLVAQSLPTLQIIVIDDGSTDNSGEIADQYAQQYSGIFVYHQANGGVSAARNAGLKHAMGEYIGFVDSDDYVEPEMFEKMYTAAKRENADIAECGYTKVWENDRRRMERLPLTARVLEDIQNVFIHCVAFHPMLWNKLFSRNLFMLIEKRFELNAGEDFLLCSRMLPYIHKAVILEDCLYFYLQRENSIMHACETKEEKSLIATIMEMPADQFDCGLWNQILFCAFAGTVHSPVSYERASKYYKSLLKEILKRPYGKSFCKAVCTDVQIRNLADIGVVGWRFYQISKLIFFMLSKSQVSISANLMKNLSKFAGSRRLREVI